jgi:hypothetical protein
MKCEWTDIDQVYDAFSIYKRVMEDSEGKKDEKILNQFLTKVWKELMKKWNDEKEKALLEED